MTHKPRTIPEVPNIDDLGVVFGEIKHLPSWKDIPEEYRRNWHNNEQPWCRLVSSWFFEGLDYEKSRLSPKKGVDKDKALRALQAILKSWAPQHEHKIAGTAYLMSQWFDLDNAS